MPSKILGIQIPESVLRIPKDYSGMVVVSDVDRTYLDTEIDSIRGLLRAAFERPERKSNVPGFSVLLRALRRGSENEAKKHPLYFLSASPSQMEPSLRAKMDLDGVEHEGLILKNQLQYIQSGEFKKLREQLGYKLGALLSLWFYLPKSSRLILFGDDSESDAIVFSLFSVVTSGGIYGKELYELLLELGVYRQEALEVSWLARHFAHSTTQAVQAAFINLDVKLTPHSYTQLAPFIYPTESSLQAAAVALENKMIRMKAVVSVARELLLRFDWSPDQIAQTLIEGCRRLLYTKATLLEIAGALLGGDILTKSLDNYGRYAMLDVMVKGFVPRGWGAASPKRSAKEWKQLFIRRSI